MTQNRKTIFAQPKAAPFLALLAAFVWGAAYPFIKLGLGQFAIDNMDTGGKTLFAGIRFTIAGLVVLLAWLVSMAGSGKDSVNSDESVSGKAGGRESAGGGKHIKESRGSASSGRAAQVPRSFTDAMWLFAYALINTTLHYFCFYIGVSNSPGSRASILNSLGTFLLVLLSCAVFREEHMTKGRILGCAVGFSGLLILNLSGGAGGAFTLMGDGMIIANALFSALGGILTRIVGRKINPLFMTGGGLFLGGLLLIAGGWVMGGRITTFTLMGAVDLAVLVSISVIGFSVYNQLVQYHPVGKIAIYNSLIPVFGIVLSCLLLGEPFLPKYIISAVLVAAGVYIINREK